MAGKVYHEGGVRYLLDYADSFNAMLADLYSVVDAVFKKAEAENVSVLTSQWQPIKDALFRLSSGPEGAYSHPKDTEELLNAFLLRLNSIYLDLMSSEGRISSVLTARSHASKLKNFVRLLNKIVNWKRRNESEMPQRIRRYPVEADLLFSDLHLDLQNALPQWQEEVKKHVLKEAEKETSAARQRTQSALTAVSPDLGAAHQKTVDLADEAKGLGSLTIEDEHFLEQVDADYIPRVLTAVERMKTRGTGFEDKEPIVLEALQQFRIIQAGIQRIIEKGIARHLDEVRAQTAFLAQKVMGDDSLTLNPGEAQAQLEATAEEAESVRDALYQKHVAPVLQANKEKYERSLAVAEERHRVALAFANEQHLKNLNREREQMVEASKQEVRDATASLRRENADLKAEVTRLNRSVNEQKWELGISEQDGKNAWDHYKQALDEAETLRAELAAIVGSITYEIAMHQPSQNSLAKVPVQEDNALTSSKFSKQKFDRDGKTLRRYRFEL